MTTVPTKDETITSGPPGAPGNVLVDRTPLGKLVVQAHRRSVGAGIDGEQMTVVAHAGERMAGQALDAAGRRSLIVAWVRGPAFVAGMAVRLRVAVKLKVEISLGLVGELAAADLPAANLAVDCSTDLAVLGRSKKIGGSISAATSAAAGAGPFSDLSASYSETTMSLREGSLSSTRSFSEVFAAGDTDRLDADRLVSKAFVVTAQASVAAQCAASGVAADARLAILPEWSFAIDVDLPEAVTGAAPAVR
jgi:hypothetical protein